MLQELLVEGPLTNLKPSMIALSLPKRKFDRAAFGVGTSGASKGGVGRYCPSDLVGDRSSATAGITEPGADKHKLSDVATAPGAVDLLGDWLRPGFSPFLGPTYGITPVANSTQSLGEGKLGGRTSSSSQIEPTTQPDLGHNISSQDSYLIDGLTGYENGVASHASFWSVAGHSQGVGIGPNAHPTFANSEDQGSLSQQLEFLSVGSLGLKGL